MTAKTKKLIALAAAFLLLFAIAAPVLSEFIDSDHACTGEDCFVCQAVNAIRTAALVVAFAAFISITLRMLLHFERTAMRLNKHKDFSFPLKKIRLQI